MSASLVTRGGGNGKRPETNSTSQCPLCKLSPEPYCPQRKAETRSWRLAWTSDFGFSHRFTFCNKPDTLVMLPGNPPGVQVGPSGYMASGSYPVYTGPRIPAVQWTDLRGAVGSLC